MDIARLLNHLYSMGIVWWEECDIPGVEEEEEEELLLDYARVKDKSCFVLLSMWVNDVWSQTTPKKVLGQTTQERMVHKG